MHIDSPRSCQILPFQTVHVVAIFYSFSQFCEILYISLLSLQTQPNAAPNLFQREVEYGKYARPPDSPTWYRL